MKYIIKEQKECSHIIFSVINSESGARINYFQDRSDAEEFASHQNSFVHKFYYEKSNENK